MQSFDIQPQLMRTHSETTEGLETVTDTSGDLKRFLKPTKERKEYGGEAAEILYCLRSSSEFKKQEDDLIKDLMVWFKPKDDSRGLIGDEIKKILFRLFDRSSIGDDLMDVMEWYWTSIVSSWTTSCPEISAEEFEGVLKRMRLSDRFDVSDVAFFYKINETTLGSLYGLEESTLQSLFDTPRDKMTEFVSSLYSNDGGEVKMYARTGGKEICLSTWEGRKALLLNIQIGIYTPEQSSLTTRKFMMRNLVDNEQDEAEQVADMIYSYASAHLNKKKRKREED
jgi:hypothetical protein